MKKMALATVAVLALCLLCFVGFAQQRTRAGSATEQVWAGEQAYWRYVKAHDITRYLALWSDDFTGWPVVNEHPEHKADVGAFVKANGSLGHVVAYELHRESVQMHGDAVITFYRATVSSGKADGSVSTTTYRMTHTWMKNNGKWQIVGGMSAVDPSAARPPQRK
ncbi:MAG TPA: nuclear transport factor 2 family protein [Candidatus Acidoferrales bacterium]|nr:nuclear transport factor 2 family protein [Candidatus Acidoferrales bacterium]